MVRAPGISPKKLSPVLNREGIYSNFILFFLNGVMNIEQAVAYNGAHMVLIGNYCILGIEIMQVAQTKIGHK